MLHILTNKDLRYMLYGRFSCSKKNIIKWICRIKLRKYVCRYGLEIGFKNIGGGLQIAHGNGININEKAVIGEYLTIFKGATVGSIRSGKREGTPKIGSRVVICCNATVVGGITIGDDVLIAAGAFVDFDVPDNSVVIGNPGMIRSKENPSKDYLPVLD